MTVVHTAPIDRVYESGQATDGVHRGRREVVFSDERLVSWSQIELPVYSCTGRRHARYRPPAGWSSRSNLTFAAAHFESRRSARDGASVEYGADAVSPFSFYWGPRWGWVRQGRAAHRLHNSPAPAGPKG